MIKCLNKYEADFSFYMIDGVEVLLIADLELHVNKGSCLFTLMSPPTYASYYSRVHERCSRASCSSPKMPILVITKIILSIFY
jgi:hypothetical protein